MKKVLVVNASARLAGSKSRMLTNVFIEEWKSIYEDPIITFRDLADGEVTFINESWIAAAAKPKQNRTLEEMAALAASDQYIAELKEADIIVLGSPMYNWSIPGVLKAYIDQVVRINETWKINRDDPANPYKGLLVNKALLLLLSRGGRGYEPGEAHAHMNFQSTYLKTVFNILGINDIHMIAINGESQDPENLKAAITGAIQSLKDVINRELV
jgi:FMN-dependent NADH-azoreductase